jgi:paraquat-inducible protein A
MNGVIPRAIDLGLAACHACGLACAAPSSAHTAHCPRCHARLHLRKPAGRARTAALLTAAAVLYLPANLVPVMHTRTLGGGFESTILEGVLEFWRAGDLDIALIIFIASVVVPCAKFTVLGYLLAAARRGAEHVRRERARLYRLIEFIGYWSMLDVVVVALLAAAVQFNQLSEVTPRPGIAFFGVVVVLTMLAALSFDPRTIWDTRDDERRG